MTEPAAPNTTSDAGEPGFVLALHAHPITILVRSLTAIVLLIVYAAFLMLPVRRASGADVAQWLLWAAVVVAVLRVGFEIARWLGRRYTLTDSTIASSDGVLRRWRVEMPLDRIQHVVLHKTIGERVLGLGTIGVSSAGGGGLEVLWIGIARPQAALDRINSARSAASPVLVRDGTGAAVSETSTRGGRAFEPVPATKSPPGRAGIDRAMVIGLAGGIGSGKSSVARALEELGAAVSDSDREARAMLQREDVKRALVGWWGDRVLTPEGQADRSIDRGAVAAIVFADPAERKRLEALIHPMLRAGREALKRQAWENGIGVVVIDAPLLFEAGLEGECDEVWFVDTPRDQRLARVRAGRGWDEAELARREAAQMSEGEKRRRCTRVVPNDGDEADMRHHVREALQQARTRLGMRGEG